MNAGSGSGLFEALFGAKPNEGVCGIGGLVSASIACYNMY